MNKATSEVTSLSTQVTVIVFWGLILIGLALALFFFNLRENEVAAYQEQAADSIGLRALQLLHDSHMGAQSDDDLQASLQAILGNSPATGVSLMFRDQYIQAGELDNTGEVLERVLHTDPSRHEAMLFLKIHFPDRDALLQNERRVLLLGLGGILLLFGVFLRGILERFLAVPMKDMVGTARAISAGDGQTTFNERRRSEFGYLAGFINQAIARLRDSEVALYQAKELAEVTLNSIADIVVRTDAEGRVEYLNEAALGILGESADSVMGEYAADVLPIIQIDTRKAVLHPVVACLSRRESSESQKGHALLKPDGGYIPVTYSAALLYDHGRHVCGAVMVMHDLSVAANLREQLSYQASHDPLTGLYNRHEFIHEIDRALELARRDGYEHSLCYMDIDQFKVVNSTCGHAAGDQLLRELVDHLDQHLRKADILCRLGGDDFGLLLTHCNIERAVAVANQVRDLVGNFVFHWHDRMFNVTASIGVVPVSPHVRDAEELLSSADIACSMAKEDGRNRVHVYQPDDSSLSRRRQEMGLVSEIKLALEEGRFELFVQSIVPVSCGSDIPHYEVLLRLRDEQGGFVSPGMFIPACERYHLMSAVDRWVVSHSIDFLIEQQAQGNDYEFSINLSGQSINDDEFLEFLIGQLGRDGVDTSRICFEITETAAIGSIQHAQQLIQRVRDMGARFALDDFGSGLSSFGYLKTLPVDFLKIDGSLVKQLDQSSHDQAMVRAIHEVARVMNMQTIAEFVENEAIFDMLKEIGVDMAQGYWLHKPESITALLRADQPGNQATGV